MAQAKPSAVRHRLENEYGTSVEAVESMDSPGRFRVDVSVEGGYSFAFSPTDRYRIDHLVGDGNGETFTMYIVEKR